jgi:diadenylate cyclase
MVGLMSFFILDKNYFVIIINNFLLLFFILFAEEFRNIFYIFGNKVENIFNRISNKLGKNANGSNSYFLDMLVKTAFKLTEQETGALICIERDISLDSIKADAIKINGIISSELLMSIFNKHSPTHDGAVIVKNETIEAAGCILPLTKREQVSKSYGTRHRAAMGITEQTDAIVILVSEERKTVHVVSEGIVSSALDRSHLLQLLEDHLNNRIEN